jgi:hypothetical protein
MMQTTTDDDVSSRGKVHEEGWNDESFRILMLQEELRLQRDQSIRYTTQLQEELLAIKTQFLRMNERGGLERKRASSLIKHLRKENKLLRINLKETDVHDVADEDERLQVLKLASFDLDTLRGRVLNTTRKKRNLTLIMHRWTGMARHQRALRHRALIVYGKTFDALQRVFFTEWCCAASSSQPLCDAVIEKCCPHDAAIAWLNIGARSASDSISAKALHDAIRWMDIASAHVEMPPDAGFETDTSTSGKPLQERSWYTLHDATTKLGTEDQPRREIQRITMEHPNPSVGLGVGVTETSPYRVTRVLEGGAAARSGNVQVGDRILSVSGNDVNESSFEEFRTLLATAGSNLTLKLSRVKEDGAQQIINTIVTISSPLQSQAAHGQGDGTGAMASVLDSQSPAQLTQFNMRNWIADPESPLASLPARPALRPCSSPHASSGANGSKEHSPNKILSAEPPLLWGSGHAASSTNLASPLHPLKDMQQASPGVSNRIRPLPTPPRRERRLTYLSSGHS